MNRFAPFASPLRLARLLAQVVVMALFVNLGPATADAGTTQPIRIVALGDSLTAGFGVAPQDAFPAQLQRALAAKGISVEVLNAGVSGDTSGGALQRLDWSVPDGVDAAIVELGANDALRGIDPKLTRGALEKIVGRLKAKGIAVLVAGMRAPSNWGEDYVRDFDSIYPDLATGSGSLFYPFFLDGIAMRTDLNQSDGLHPTAAGVAEIVRRILPKVEELVERVRTLRAAASKG